MVSYKKWKGKQFLSLRASGRCCLFVCFVLLLFLFFSGDSSSIPWTATTGALSSGRKSYFSSETSYVCTESYFWFHEQDTWIWFPCTTLGMQWSRHRLHDLLLNCYFFIFQSIFLLTFKSSNQCITARLLQCVALYILWHINIYVYVLHMYIYLYLHDNK